MVNDALTGCHISFKLHRRLALHLDLDVFAFESLDHELVLLTRGEAGSDRFPWPARPDAAVFRLADADQAFFRGRVDRMVIDGIAPLELPGNRMLARERVGLVHRHQPT